VGVGLDPGPFAASACVSGANNAKLRIEPASSSGRRMLLISPHCFVGSAKNKDRKMSRR
jgi:hypothetical protein